MAQNDTNEVRKEALWVISNATNKNTIHDCKILA